jgi:tungstate transport system substrate-binding protein
VDIATTTSVKNSGLLDAILPSFREARIHVHAAGSGRALEMLADGVVDLVMTHAPDAEARYLAEHPDWAYRKFAYNRFVIVGPPEDPAGVRHAADAVDAFRRIAVSPMTFVSRGDESGTHERERALWKTAGVTPSSDHLVTSGNSMAMALWHTHERQGYTLADEATFRQHESRLQLVVLLASDPRLVNTYAVLYPRESRLSAVFAEWLTEGEGRAKLALHTVAGGPAFTSWPVGCPAQTPAALPCS